MEAEAGSDLLDLLREVRVPVVTTLHTILTDPISARRRATAWCSA